jgi:hypothetical protein
MWHFFVYDTPAKHPRIQQEEKEYILKSQNISANLDRRVSELTV